MAFGLVLMAMVYAIGNVSGCHINPAVSLAMLIRKDINAKEFCMYVISQVIGGLAAGALLFKIFGADSSLGCNGLYNGDIAVSAIIEIILTFVFIFTILQVTAREECGAVAGIVIGVALLLVHLLGIGFTGTSVNPARSLVAVFKGGEALQALPVFIIAPLIGAAAAACVHKVFAKNE